MTGGDAVRDCKADPTVRILDAATQVAKQGRCTFKERIS
jgi:hypothetical protein